MLNNGNLITKNMLEHSIRKDKGKMFIVITHYGALILFMCIISKMTLHTKHVNRKLKLNEVCRE